MAFETPHDSVDPQEVDDGTAQREYNERSFKVPGDAAKETALAGAEVSTAVQQEDESDGVSMNEHANRQAEDLATREAKIKADREQAGM